MRWVPAGLLAVAHGALWPLFFGGGLNASAAWLALLSIGPLLALLMLLVVVVHAIRRRRFSGPMIATSVLSLIFFWPGLWNFGLFQIAFPVSLADASPSVSVRLPSDEALHVAWGGDELDTNYHAVTPDQRWAYDFVIGPAMHGSSNPENYGCYGTPVLAPISAVVHYAEDGVPDEVPGVSTNTEAPFGNHVVLALETGTYLILAHLKEDSVAVRAGDEVEEGEPIGLCGNSGNTSEPHIHIHHQRQDPTQVPINFAEGLPLYFRDHDGEAMPKGGIEIIEGMTVLTGDVVKHQQVP